MRIFGGIEDDGDRGRRDWESTHAKKGAPVWALNTRYYSNTSGISSGLTLLMVGRTGWLLLPPPPPRQRFQMLLESEDAWLFLIMWDIYASPRIIISKGIIACQIYR